MSNQFLSSELVNYKGERINMVGPSFEAPPRPKKIPEPTHKGWRVVGFSPEHIAEAKADREKDIEDALRRNKDYPQRPAKVPAPFDLQSWLMTAKPRPVRSKPYEIPQAAELCKELAEKSGWMKVQVIQLKSE